MGEQTSPADLLQNWLQRHLHGDAAAWLDEALASLADDSSDRQFFKLFSFVTRKIGKDDLPLGEDDLKSADAARPGWDPRLWSTDQAARVLLLLRSETDPAKFFTRAEQLFITSDVGEAVALYRGLPLYPGQKQFAARGAEGIRTNMKGIFEAVAHRNPFAKEQFDENAWNQMVLKALFIESPLWPIQGLDERANPTLARMLVDYAHERWAAHRSVSPELWRCVGPYADDTALDDLAKVLAKGSEKEQQAAALALASCPDERAKESLSKQAGLATAVSHGELTWNSLMGQIGYNCERP